MPSTDVFVSVGSTSTERQEAFVRAIEDRLRSEGLNPRTLGRSDFSSEAPLKPIKEMMRQCAGVVVIALERTYFPAGTDRRGGPKEAALEQVVLPTPWNQIEAALAYGMGLPLLVIVEEGLRSEGLLEARYDWYVQWVPVDAASLNSPQFNGVLADWKKKLSAMSPTPDRKKAQIDPGTMSIGDLVGALRPAQVWTAGGALVTVIAGAFALGAKLLH